MVKLRFCLLSLRFIRTFFVFAVFQFAFLRFISLRFCGFQHFLLCGSRFLFLIIDTCNSSGIFFFYIPGPFPAACGKMLCFLLLITISVFIHTFSISHPHCIHIMITCNCFAFRSGQPFPKRTHPHSDKACPSWTPPLFGQGIPQVDRPPVGQHTCPIRTDPIKFFS